MLKRRIEMLVIASVLTISSVHVYAVDTIGEPSCVEWSKVRRSNTWQTLEVQAWLIGYLSGLAIATDKDIAKGTVNASIHAWVDNYCRENPLMYLSDGASAWYRVQVREKNL
jgi:hypothetical protein